MCVCVEGRGGERRAVSDGVRCVMVMGTFTKTKQ